MKSRVYEKSEIAAAASAPETRRLNLNLSQKAYDEVAVLSKKYHRSMTEIIRLGLGLAKVALDEAEKGNKLVVTDEGGEQLKEIILP